MLSFKNLGVRGCGVQILRDLDLDFPEKGVAVLLGPSGCGKTTLLRATIREDEEDPDLEATGSVLLDGVDVRASHVDVASLRQRVGLVAQRPVAFPGTAFDNVTFALRYTTRLPKREVRARAERALREVGLEEKHWGTEAECLSGGQLKRLSIARAIALEPSVLLLDEPSNGLDPLAVARLEVLVGTLARRRLVVCVTHDVHLANRLGGRVYFLWPFFDGCRLVETGETVEVLDHPRQPETRLFVEAALSGARALARYEGSLCDEDQGECRPRSIDLGLARSPLDPESCD